MRGYRDRTAAAADKVSAGLVNVNVTLGYQQASAAGTGLVLTAKGEVLTNNHVIQGATTISVTDIGNGRTYTATVVGYDRTHDIAVTTDPHPRCPWNRGNLTAVNSYVRPLWTSRAARFRRVVA